MGALCPALTKIRRRVSGVYWARNAVVKRRPFWLLLQAYLFMPRTRSVRDVGVAERVLRLAWKVAMRSAAGMLLPATSATAKRNCGAFGSCESAESVAARAKTS